MSRCPAGLTRSPLPSMCDAMDYTSDTRHDASPATRGVRNPSADTCLGADCSMCDTAPDPISLSWCHNPATTYISDPMQM